MSQLTICSAYHNSKTKKFLELNWKLTKELNSFQNWVWLVVDNTPLDFDDKIDPSKFKVVRGVTRSELIAQLEPGLKHKNLVGAFHHSSAIHRALSRVESRYVLILDDDFFIVQPDWIRDVLNFMKERNLALFGAPYYPLGKKYRYFPTLCCLFIDTSQVDLKKLDFNPVYVPDPRFLRHLPSFLKRIRGSVKRRFTLEKDGGILLYRNLKRTTIRYKCVLPVYKEKLPSNPLMRWMKLLVKAILPDQWQYAPKRRNSYVTRNFSEYGYFDPASYCGEEFMWEGKPFGFHMRGFRFSKIRMNEDEEFAMLGGWISDLCEKVRKNVHFGKGAGTPFASGGRY